MATLLKNNFVGQTLGEATVANSGSSGNPFALLFKTGNGAFSYVTANSSTALRVTFDTGGGLSYPRWNATGADGRRAIARRTFHYDPSAHPTGTFTLVDIRTDVDEVAAIANLQLHTNGQIQISAGGDIVASRWQMPAAAGWYALELAVISASETGAGDAQAAYRIYDTDGETLLQEYVSDPLNRTASPPNIVRWTGATASTGKTFDEMDEPQALFTDDLTSWLGPFADTRVLPTPDVSVVSVAKPTAPNTPDGTVTVTWQKLDDPDVSHYELSAAAGRNAASGFVVKQIVPHSGAPSTITSTAWGLESGTHTIAVRAMPN